jgi:hypothetical protein
MLRSLHMLALALATTLGIASSASAITSETALRANRDFPAHRVTDFGEQAREAHQQITLGYGRNASDSSLAARGGTKVAAEVAEEIGILRSAARGNGNFGLGAADAATAQKLGEAWVGAGAKVASDGKTLISANGLRQFRPPSWKPNLSRVQANFEQRAASSGPWNSNGHLDILYGPAAP